jgi:uncharacterized protein YbaP (TraB family)
MAAFNAAGTVALEFLESETPKSALEEMMAAKGFYASGGSLKDVLTKAELDTLRKTLGAEGLPAQAVHLLRPWLAVFMLALPPCEKRRTNAGLVYLDKRLERDAIAQGKRVVGPGNHGAADRRAGRPAGSGADRTAQGNGRDASAARRRARGGAPRLSGARSRDLVPFTKHIVERAGHDPSPLDDFERDIATKRNYGMRDASLPLLQQGAPSSVSAPCICRQGGAGRALPRGGYTVTPIE